MVVVDAKAKWMRVERHRQQQQQQKDQRGSHHHSLLCSGPPYPVEPTTTRSVTYDLGKHAAGRRKETRSGGGGGGGGGSRESGERMPRDVKDRMKVLPRFIAILKDAPTPARARGGRPKDVASAERSGEAGRRHSRHSRREAGP
ncbi:unnamed protein product [Ectocarpus fasciculatus]